MQVSTISKYAHHMHLFRLQSLPNNYFFLFRNICIKVKTKAVNSTVKSINRLTRPVCR